MPRSTSTDRQSSVMQGITTEIAGNCGDSAFPLVGYFLKDMPSICTSCTVGKRSSLENPGRIRRCGKFPGVSVNIGLLAGHASIRTAVSDYADRDLTEEEYKEAERLLRKLRARRFRYVYGPLLCAGQLCHYRGSHQVSKIVAEYDGFVSCHLRTKPTTTLAYWQHIRRC